MFASTHDPYAGMVLKRYNVHAQQENIASDECWEAPPAALEELPEGLIADEI
ncbi:hypothetical protein SAMN06265795_101506 [Noviherbaspirillum humi]|uniref:Uncharacterized protein n=1 Tax=Noviherbaspirillum humi TaxID=1688639 RepID=A0A239CM80_9BURK|nr:hypothetical protein [Noviherbaspirillum humi]SNS20453.1 hypothetical protein SAMN06265795_101506 [Noviherbaspirillum humi]